MLSVYALCIGLSCVVMGIGAYRQMRNLWYVLFFLCLGLVGARALHVITNSSHYLKFPEHIFALGLEGLSLYGAFALVSIVSIAGYRHFPFSLWKVADGMTMYLAAGIAIARIGCFLNGCCFGVISSVPWAVRFPLLSESHKYQISTGVTNILTVLPVHPTQLYEAFGALASVAIALWVQKKKKKAGVRIIVFILLFSCVRLIVHYFRVFPDSFEVSKQFPGAYITVIALSLYALRQKCRRE